MPQWKKFSSNVSSTLEKSTNNEVQEAISYYKENPPQIENSPQNFTEQAPNVPPIIQVYRVRCNLFHGGKYILPEQEHNPDRYRMLIKYGAIILEEAVAIDKDVKQHFWSQ